MKHIALLLLVTLLIFPLQAQYDSLTVAQARLRLNEVHQQYAQLKNTPVSDMYPVAEARLDYVESLLRLEPDSPETLQKKQYAMIAVEAAVLQMQAIIDQMRIEELQIQIQGVLGELKAINDEIATVERGYSDQLQNELASEREKLQQMIDEERQRADEQARELERQKEEYNRRFQELQSELISVKQDARGTIISMSDILFATNQSDLTPELKTSLARIAGILLVYKRPNIIIEGHTDNTGTEEYNQKLSEARAKSVMNFLIEQGVGRDRLTAVGHSFRKPIADNDTPEGRSKNRRVDLVIQD